jgi:hypothetical protein
MIQMNVVVAFSDDIDGEDVNARQFVSFYFPFPKLKEKKSIIKNRNKIMRRREITS